jgi:N-acetyl-alpha-D-glucosaminyl L-malate synthase BshA
MGGSGVVATELARALAEGGDEVHLLSYALPARWSGGGQGLFFHPVTVGQYPLFEYPPYSLALATKMVEVVRHHQLDLLHVHYAVPNAISAILAREILLPDPIRVITTLHGTDVTLVGNDPSYLETTRLAIQRSDCVTAVSEALREATLEQLGNGREIRVLPNFIDPQRYLDVKERGGARVWGEEGERIIVHISNFRRVKRVRDVVRIFELVSRDQKVRLLLAGEGPELARTEQFCRELNVSDRVVFLGTVSNVEELLSGADVFLLPSETESFGLAALEALSCEVPVVASRIGGLPEVVEDGVTGFLRPVGDVEGMAEAICRLLREEDLRRGMGRRGRSSAIERFSREDIVKQYRELYQEVLAREPAAGNGMFARS